MGLHFARMMHAHMNPKHKHNLPSQPPTKPCGELGEVENQAKAHPGECCLPATLYIIQVQQHGGDAGRSLQECSRERGFVGLVRQRWMVHGACRIGCGWRVVRWG